MARNVKIVFDKPLVTTFPSPREIEKSPLLNQPIPMLAPGRRINIHFDSLPSRQEQGLPMTYTVSLSYEDAHGRAFHDPPYPLDLAMYADTAVEPKGLPELVQEVVKLHREVGKCTAAIRGLRQHQ